MANRLARGQCGDQGRESRLLEIAERKRECDGTNLDKEPLKRGRFSAIRQPLDSTHILLK